MQVIPMKEKYDLAEQDIDKLSRMLAEGCSLQHMAYVFKGRLNPEQLYLVSSIISREMYDMQLAEMCPHIIEERKTMNAGKAEHWQQEKKNVGIIQLLKSVADDLALYEMELLTGINSKG